MKKYVNLHWNSTSHAGNGKLQDKHAQENCGWIAAPGSEPVSIEAKGLKGMNSLQVFSSRPLSLSQY